MEREKYDFDCRFAIDYFLLAALFCRGYINLYLIIYANIINNEIFLLINIMIVLMYFYCRILKRVIYKRVGHE